MYIRFDEYENEIVLVLYEKAYQEEQESSRGKQNCVMLNQVLNTAVLNLIIIIDGKSVSIETVQSITTYTVLTT